MKQKTIVAALVEFANAFDDKGLEKEAQVFDQIATRVAGMSDDEYYFAGDTGYNNPDDYASEIGEQGQEGFEDRRKEELEFALSMMTDDQRAAFEQAVQGGGTKEFEQQLAGAGANVNPFDD